MIAFLKRMDVWGSIWMGVVALLAMIVYSNIPHDGGLPANPLVAGIMLGTLALGAFLLIVGLLAGRIRFLALRETQLTNGFEWRRPLRSRLFAVAILCWLVALVCQQTFYLDSVWRDAEWPVIVALTGLGGVALMVLIVRAREIIAPSVVLRVTSEGLTADGRTVAWSQVEAAIFGRYRWHEFGLLLIDGDGRDGREWWFSLRDAGIEAPHFLDRLERGAPQVTVLKPEGEPMRGARPIPAVRCPGLQDATRGLGHE